MQQLNKVWSPIPNSSQVLALTSPAHETLYCGTRGNGKTDVQIMSFLQHVGKGYGPYWRGIIFDRRYKNLDDIVARTKKWFTAMNNGAVFLSNKADYRWKWPTGEELLIRAAEDVTDYDDYHGQEFPFIGWNELTKYPTKDLYEAMTSCNRSSFTPEKDSPRDKNGNPILPPIPLIIFSTTNPWGAGRTWVKKYFIDPAPYGTIIVDKHVIVDPRTQDVVEFETTRVAIFGYFAENIYLPNGYIADLTRNSSKNQRKAWLEGDWDAAAGGAFEDVWDSDVHIVPNFCIPSGWNLYRAFDWGSSAPFYVGWFAEANGEEVILPDGRIFCPAEGSLILFDEWYGVGPDGKGIKLGATAIAAGILEREGIYPTYRVCEDHIAPHGGPADGQIFNKINDDDYTIAEHMSLQGVEWERADKSQGSRVHGLELVRERFRAAKSGEGRALYFMRRCKYAIDLVPSLPNDPDKPDDVDTKAEDHAYDVMRYMVLYKAVEYVTSIRMRHPA